MSSYEHCEEARDYVVDRYTGWRRILSRNKWFMGAGISHETNESDGVSGYALAVIVNEMPEDRIKDRLGDLLLRRGFGDMSISFVEASPPRAL